MRARYRLLAVLCALSLSGSVAVAADINGMSGGGPEGGVAGVAPQCGKAAGRRPHFTQFRISAMAQKLNAGEKPDMVLMPVPAIEARVKDGSLRHDAWAKLGTVRVAMIVREGAAKPDISSLEAFKNTMLAAKSVVHSNPAATPSGGH